MSEMVQQEMLLSLAQRIVESGELLETLARDHRVSEKDLRQCVHQYRMAKEKIQRDEYRKREIRDLIPGFVKMATSFQVKGRSLNGAREYKFEFPEVNQERGRGQSTTNPTWSGFLENLQKTLQLSFLKLI